MHPQKFDSILIFTDGACSGNPGSGGWAAVVATPDGHVRELGAAVDETTNNRMEMAAVIHALRHVQKYPQKIGFLGAFPIQTDDYFYRVVRYVERNALRANLVQRADPWRWSSLSTRENFSREVLADWPLPRPSNWREVVNQPQTESEIAALRNCVNRSAACGDQQWIAATAKLLRVESTVRPRGRPKRGADKA